MESTPYLYQTRFVYHNLHETLAEGHAADLHRYGLDRG